jgi:hypothetical protein
MAAIYSPWDNPDEPTDFLLASAQFMHPATEADSEGPEELGESMPEAPEAPDMMAAAMQTIQQQSQLIQQLTQQLTGGASSE